jgi:50S ribosomal subunit-associated GTPase HflX
MGEPALIASQSGRVTDGLAVLVDAGGWDPVSTLVTDRPEDGEYYLSPATVETVERRAADTDGESTLVVDGEPHPGQLADLRARLPSMTVLDRRMAVWDRLAATNPVAETRAALLRARVDRRAAAAAQRADETRSPSGTSGRLAECDERVQRLRDRLERRRERARDRVRTGFDDADARVVLVGRVGAPTTAVWTALTGEDAEGAPGRPARPRTATATVGPHTPAVTDTPGVPGEDGLPEWLTAAVPGLEAALSAATRVLVVGDRREALRSALAQRFDAPCRGLADPTADAARSLLRESLPTAAFAVQLPYDDDAHALVSTLHDRATVHETAYDDAVYLRVTVAATATERLRRRVAAVDGEVEPLDAE